MTKTLADRVRELCLAQSVQCQPRNDFDKGVIFGKGETVERLRALLAEAREEPGLRNLVRRLAEALDSEHESREMILGRGHREPCKTCALIVEAKECVVLSTPPAPSDAGMRERVAQLEKALDDYYQDGIDSKELWAIRQSALSSTPPAKPVDPPEQEPRCSECNDTGKVPVMSDEIPGIQIGEGPCICGQSIPASDPPEGKRWRCKTCGYVAPVSTSVGMFRTEKLTCGDRYEHLVGTGTGQHWCGPVVEEKETER